MTARDLVQKAFQKTGVMEIGGALSPALEKAGFDALVNLMDEWKGLLIPAWTDDSFSLAAGTGSYTIGATGTVVKTRPEFIDAAFVRDSSGQDHHVDIIDEAKYRTIFNKTQQGRPFQAWYNGTVPNGTLTLYYVPSSIETFHYSHLSALTVPTNLADTLVIPARYKTPLVWNLALELTPDSGRTDLIQLITARAIQTKNALISSNAQRNMKLPRLEITHVAYESGNVNDIGG